MSYVYNIINCNGRSPSQIVFFKFYLASWKVLWPEFRASTAPVQSLYASNVVCRLIVDMACSWCSESLWWRPNKLLKYVLAIWLTLNRTVEITLVCWCPKAFLLEIATLAAAYLKSRSSTSAPHASPAIEALSNDCKQNARLPCLHVHGLQIKQTQELSALLNFKYWLLIMISRQACPKKPLLLDLHSSQMHSRISIPGIATRK